MLSLVLVYFCLLSYPGGQFSESQFIKKMHPHHHNQAGYSYPLDSLLQVERVLSANEISNPQQVDFNGKRCRMVCKNGGSTGATIGRLASMDSFVRTYAADGRKQTSREQVAVHSYSNRDGAFSARGDSGVIVVDLEGKIAGMLVVGAGTTEAPTSRTSLLTGGSRNRFKTCTRMSPSIQLLSRFILQSGFSYM